jgi:hypothetical protein
MTIEKIAVAELRARMKAQGVSSNKHVAFKCPICATVQSMASLERAGLPADNCESIIAFSCEGRVSGAGPWPSEKDHSAKAVNRRKVRGCDWTLGGLLRLHELVVVLENGRECPSFVLATAEEAQALERLMQ